MNARRLLPLVAAAPIGLAALPPDPVDLERDVAHLLPAETLVYVDAPGAHEVFVQGLRHPLVATLLRSPVGDLVREEAKVPPALALGMLNVWAGRPVLPALAKMTEGGLAVGVLPRDGEPIVCLSARGDAATWSEVVELVLTKVGEQRELPLDKLVPPHRRLRGMDMWLLGDDGAMALEDGVFLMSNDEETLRAMIDLGATEEPAGLGARPGFRAARERPRADASFAWAWADLAGMQAAGAELEDLRQVATAPAAHLLFGSMLAQLSSAREGVLEVTANEERLGLEVTGLGVVPEPAEALWAPAAHADGHAPRLPAAVDGESARALVYRDFAEIFHRRVELFPARAQPAFAEATSNLALFFEGADVIDDVLPGLDPWLGLVARDVEFDDGAAPSVPLPGVALVVRLREPESLGPRLVSAFQTLVAVTNIEAAQQRRPGLTLGLELDEGRTITTARYREPAEGEGVDVRYNLVPACTLVENAFVVGTHVSVVRDVARQLAAGEVAESLAGGESLELSGAQLATVLEANRDAIVMNAVLAEGKTEEQALGELRGIVRVAETVERLELATARVGDEEVRFSLSMHLAGEEVR